MSVIKKTLLVLALIQLAACASKKPKDETPTPDQNAAAMDSKISSDALDPNAMVGSDSNKFAGLTTIHFDYDRAVVSTSEAAILRKNAEWIKSHSDVKIQIEGHCDHRGSVEYNLALGERRAKAVYNILLDAGIPKSRLSTISFGDQRPIESGDSDEAYAKNRRANFLPLSAPQTHLSSITP